MAKHECPICRERVKPGKSDVLQPCRCTTYVHRDCIEEWIEEKKRNKRNHKKCEVCQTRYQYTATKKVNTEGINECCLDTFFWIMVVLAYVVCLCTVLLTGYGYTTFDLYYSSMDVTMKVLLYIFPFGAVCFLIMVLYFFLVWGCDDFIRGHGCTCDINDDSNINEKSWKDVFIVILAHYLTTLLVGIFFSFFQIVGITFYHLFKGEKPFYKFRPTAGTFGIGVGMTAAIVIGILLIVFGIYGLACWCVCCGRCMKDICVKEERVLGDFRSSDEESYYTEVSGTNGTSKTSSISSSKSMWELVA